MDSLESNKTWNLMDFPHGWKQIGCKWILKRKLKLDRTIAKSKARLLQNTFSPFIRITFIRLLIFLVDIHNFEARQMDVKTIFLNRGLEKEIYMKQPEGFVTNGKESKICKLDKFCMVLNKTIRYDIKSLTT